MLSRQVVATAAISFVGLKCQRPAVRAESLKPCQAAPPVFVLRHAQSVQNFNQHTCINDAQKRIEDIVADLLTKSAKKGDADWKVACKEIASAVSKSKEWWKQGMVDDSHLPPEKRDRDAVLTKAGISATLGKADSQVEQLPSEGPRRVLLIVSPLTRTMMTAALLFHKLPKHGVEIDLVLEPGIAESFYWPHDMINNIGRNPNVALAETCQQLSGVAPGGGLEVMFEKLQQAAKFLPAKWFVRAYQPGQQNKVTLLWDWNDHVIDMEFLHKHREATFHSIRQHVAGQQDDYCAVYVVCHALTMAKLFSEPTQPLKMNEIPRNRECRRIDIT